MLMKAYEDTISKINKEINVYYSHGNVHEGFGLSFQGSRILCLIGEIGSYHPWYQLVLRQYTIGRSLCCCPGIPKPIPSQSY